MIISREIKRVEWVTAVLLSAVVLVLLVVETKHAGALWRDECDALQMARMNFTEMVENFQSSSFPVLFPVTIRGYTTLFGTNDLIMRFFGLAVGISLICLTWFHSKTLNDEAPLVLLALVGLNTIFLTVGTSIRGYGLGSVLVVLAFTLTAKLLLRPSKGRLAALFVAYLVGMQCLFFDGALVPGIVLAASATWLVRSRWNWVLLLLGVALICGLSYIPYLRLYSGTTEWAVVLRMTPSFSSLWQELMNACGAPASMMPFVWFGVLGLSIIGAVWRLAIVWRSRHVPEWDLILFALLSILISAAGYYAFLRVLHNAPNPRYFLALLCLWAVAADQIAANLSVLYWVRIVRLIVVIGLMVALPFAAWPEITRRQTNMDRLAQEVQKGAGPNDLIVVNPWSLGVSFHRYYQGPARWLTVPQLSEHRVHRYDLLKAKMAESAPLEDVENEMGAALKAGNRVWIAGFFSTPGEGSRPFSLPPAPDATYGWQFPAYRRAWTEELGIFIQRHVLRVNSCVLPAESVRSQENVPLWTLEGWRD